MYTYGALDSVSVFLEGNTCQNAKNNYFLEPTKVDNVKQIISMLLTAKAVYVGQGRGQLQELMFALIDKSILYVN